jgi:hypothetical protein
VIKTVLFLMMMIGAAGAAQRSTDRVPTLDRPGVSLPCYPGGPCKYCPHGICPGPLPPVAPTEVVEIPSRTSVETAGLSDIVMHPWQSIWGTFFPVTPKK